MASFKQGKIKYGFASTVTSGGTLSLTSSSLQYQIFTGSSSHSLILPDATTLANGIAFNVINASTGTITIYLHDGSTVQSTLSSNSAVQIILTTNGVSNGTWSNKIGAPGTSGGIGSVSPGSDVSSVARAVWAGGDTGGAGVNTIEYIVVSNLTSSSNFGNLTQARSVTGAASSQTRGVWAGGYSGGVFTTIDYVTIATTGNATSFGSLSTGREELAGLANSTRGIFAGGSTTGSSGGASSIIDYITIATTGNSTSFGSLLANSYGKTGTSSSIRGIIAGDASNSATMEYITIATTGNSASFGNLSVGRRDPAACANTTLALFGGGYTSSAQSVIDYVTIQTLANAVSFGSLSAGREIPGAAATAVHGLWAGGYGGGSTYYSVMDYVTFSILSSASSFGNLSANKEGAIGLSSQHGGLF